MATNRTATSSAPRLLAAGDDALAAIRVLDDYNHIIVLTPKATSDNTFAFASLVEAITSFNKSVHVLEFATDGTSPSFTSNHERALNAEIAAAVIVLVVDGPTRKVQEKFAETVWGKFCEDEEMSGILVLVGGTDRSVGGFRTTVRCNSIGQETQKAIAKIIFSG